MNEYFIGIDASKGYSDGSRAPIKYQPHYRFGYHRLLSKLYFKDMLNDLFLSFIEFNCHASTRLFLPASTKTPLLLGRSSVI